MIRSIVYTLVCLGLMSGCSGQHLEIFPPLGSATLMQEKISEAKLRQDVDAFYEGVSERHPALENYADIADLEQQVASLKSAITTPMTRVEFYRLVGRLSHQFNDGHSFLLWPYQELTQLTEAGNVPFPFAVEINADGLFVKRPYTNGDQRIVAGSEILTINGHPATDLIVQAQHYVGGETRMLREQFVAARFAHSLWSVFGMINQFELRITRDGDEQIIVVDAAQNWTEAEDADTSDFYYKTLKSNVGYLYIGHFDVDPDWFEDFVDDTFSSLRQQNIRHLIIDIRDNTGGNTDTATYLSQYIADKPFQLVSGVKEKLNADNRGLFNYKGNKGEVIDKPWDEWVSPVAAEDRFTGEVYLLISQVTYSSGIVFATTLKDNGFATLVGQTTGGFANQTAQGNLFNLPHSKLRVYVATRLLVRPNGNSEVKGVEPHIETRHDKQSVQSGRDTEIDTVMSLINE